MAINFVENINFQGLENISGKVGTQAGRVLAKINQSAILAPLVGENIEMAIGLAAYTFYTGGTDIIFGLDRNESGTADQALEINADIWGATGTELDARQYLVNSDTNIEERFFINRRDLMKANPVKAQAALQQKLYFASKHSALSLSADILALLTGQVSAADNTNGADYTKITKYGNTALGQGTNIADYLDNYKTLSSKLDILSNKVGAHSLGTDMSDYIAIVSKDTYRELSYALERYTGNQVKSISKNVITMAGGLNVARSMILGNSFKKADKTNVRNDKDYDFTNIKAVIVHKLAFAIKLWNLFDVYTDVRSGHLFFTTVSSWGTKTGLIRPEQVAYFTTDA